MTIRILCLSVIFLLATVTPFGFIRSFMMFPGAEKINKTKFFERGFLILLIICTICSVILFPQARNINIPHTSWYGIGVVVAAGVILGEVAIGVIAGKIKGSKVLRIEISEGFKNRNFLELGVIVFIGLLEEIIYRKVWFMILGEIFALNVFIVLCITSLVYAYNHIHLGKNVFIQKIYSGIIFGVLFILSGSVLIPIVAHITQNIFVVLVGRK